jgi:hypothetical protein
VIATALKKEKGGESIAEETGVVYVRVDEVKPD